MTAYVHVWAISGYDVLLKVGEHVGVHSVLVARDMTQECLLGTDFLERYNCQVFVKATTSAVITAYHRVQLQVHLASDVEFPSHQVRQQWMQHCTHIVLGDGIDQQYMLLVILIVAYSPPIVNLISVLPFICKAVSRTPKLQTADLCMYSK